MALTTAPQGFAAGLKLFTQSSATNTASVNLLNGSATIYSIVVDNRNNVAKSYLKLYNDPSPVVGTTIPDCVFAIAAQDKRTIYIPSGLVFDTALSVACVTAGGTAGTTSPSSAVPVSIIASE